LIEGALAVATADVIELDDLPPTVRVGYAEAILPSLMAQRSMRAWASRYAKAVLDQCQGNKRAAARALSISYHTLIAHLKYPAHEPVLERVSATPGISGSTGERDEAGRRAREVTRTLGRQRWRMKECPMVVRMRYVILPALAIAGALAAGANARRKRLQVVCVHRFLWRRALRAGAPVAAMPTLPVTSAIRASLAARPAGQVRHYPKPNLTFSASTTVEGEVQIEASGGDFGFRKRVQRTGAYTLDLEAGGDALQFRVTGSDITITRGKTSRHHHPGLARVGRGGGPPATLGFTAVKKLRETGAMFEAEGGRFARCSRRSALGCGRWCAHRRRGRASSDRPAALQTRSGAVPIGRAAATELLLAVGANDDVGLDGFRRVRVSVELRSLVLRAMERCRPSRRGSRSSLARASACGSGRLSDESAYLLLARV
jgi:hypothetical protein